MLTGHGYLGERNLGLLVLKLCLYKTNRPLNVFIQRGKKIDEFKCNYRFAVTWLLFLVIITSIIYSASRMHFWTAALTLWRRKGDCKGKRNSKPAEELSSSAISQTLLCLGNSYDSLLGSNPRNSRTNNKAKGAEPHAQHNRVPLGQLLPAHDCHPPLPRELWTGTKVPLGAVGQGQNQLEVASSAAPAALLLVWAPEIPYTCNTSCTWQFSS